MHTLMTDSSWTLLSFSAHISAASVLLHAHTCDACVRAPELMGVEATANAKSVFWALACIVLEMYTGCTWPVGVVSARLHCRPANDGFPEPLAVKSIPLSLFS